MLIRDCGSIRDMTETFMRATMPFLTVCLSALPLTRLAAACLAEPAGTTNLPVEITWGHRSANVRPFYVKLAGRELALANTKLAQGESTDALQDGVARTSADAGDVDGLSCTLQFAPKSIEPITNAHPIWKHLWKHGDADAAQRLQADPACRPDSRKLTVQLNEAGTRGFSLTVDQLLTQKNFWLPELDVFVSAFVVRLRRHAAGSRPSLEGTAVDGWAARHHHDF